MSPRLSARLDRPISFAHRGARADAAENTVEAFTLAREKGASGLESDVWLTADGHCVLDHDGVVGRVRRRRIRNVTRADLPDHIPTLDDLYAACGTGMHLSLDVKDADAFGPVVDVARAAGDDAVERLWLCHPDWETVAAWRRTPAGRTTGIRLVDSTRLRHMKDGPERRASDLADAGIDAVNLHYLDWTGGLTTLFHRFDLNTFGWDAQLPRVLHELLDMGIDAVYSDHVDRMVAAVNEAYGPE